MTKGQRRKYEMFVRVRNFGVVNRDVFPETTGGGQTFAQVAEAVATIEEHLTRREQARAEARKVKATTRAAVTRYMKAIAATGRRVAEREPGTHPFRMPARKSAPVILTTARLFMEAAERRTEKFVGLGMAPTFLADFRKLVDELAQAIALQQDSRGSRRRAQAGIERTLALGFAAVRDLDVTVGNALRDDPIRLAQWDGARRIEGQGSSPAVKIAVVSEPAPELTPAPVLQPVMEKAS
jgi:hypothetical protein